MTRLFAGTPFDRPPRCERCGELEEACQCEPLPQPPPERIAPEKQTAKLSTEKRRRGKLVTVVRGLSAAGNDLPQLLSELKTACGAGGSIQDEQLEIQGDQLAAVSKTLQAKGYRVSGR